MCVCMYACTSTSASHVHYTKVYSSFYVKEKLIVCVGIDEEKKEKKTKFYNITDDDKTL